MPDHSQMASEEISGVVPTDPTSSPASAAHARADELADALHEVSNALTVILGWLERARTESHSPSAVGRALDIAAARASQARDLVRRAIGAEVQGSAPRPAASIVAETVIGLEPEARREGIKVDVIADRVAERLFVAPTSSVAQILINLLLNAISVSPRGAAVTIDIRVHHDRRRVVFGVSDEGPGIPEDRRATLFTAGVSTRPGGAGIGLRHAAGLARAAGGELTLVDAARGARFELSWPLAGDAPLPHEARAHRITLVSGGSSSVSTRKPSLAGARILLVEDDDAVIDLLDTALTARGADVVSIKSHRELGSALAGGPFDAALFDISPIRDDIEGALAEVRRTSNDVRVVLISGSAVHMPNLPAEWVTAWVRKPFEVGEVIQALDPQGRTRLPSQAGSQASPRPPASGDPRKA